VFLSGRRRARDSRKPVGTELKPTSADVALQVGEVDLVNAALALQAV
jgi:hypothetical protein